MKLEHPIARAIQLQLIAQEIYTQRQLQWMVTQSGTNYAALVSAREELADALYQVEVAKAQHRVEALVQEESKV